MDCRIQLIFLLHLQNTEKFQTIKFANFSLFQLENADNFKLCNCFFYNANNLILQQNIDTNWVVVDLKLISIPQLKCTLDIVSQLVYELKNEGGLHMRR